MPEHAVMTRSNSTLGLVLRSQLYRRAMVSLFFAGLGISVALPQLSLFLVQDLSASLPVAGLFFLTNLAAPVLGFVVGRWSDRLTDRLSLFRVGAVVGLVAWVVMAFTTEVWMAFVLNLTLLGFAGATGTDLRRGAGPADTRSDRRGQPCDVGGPARVQSGFHDRPGSG
jgi:MFS transporter, SET family, sugar efflux transporter